MIVSIKCDKCKQNFNCNNYSLIENSKILMVYSHRSYNF